MRNYPVQEEDFDAKARSIEEQMTDEERFSLIYSLQPLVSVVERDKRVPADISPCAGYVAGVPRLGVPALKKTDAGLGVTNPREIRPGDTATAFPSSLALGSTFNPALARAQGTVIGLESRLKGFNVLLGAGMNLIRDPRNGRNFEYISEDPLLTAMLAAELVIGIQTQKVISVIKHFSLNSNETNRHWIDAIIDPAAHRESDLLAFQITIERSQPGSIMGAYNKVNGVYACGNDELINQLLKGIWGYKGWVMSDWGAVYDWTDAIKGLDQESGAQTDKKMNSAEWFVEPIREAYEAGKLPKERLADMIRRILRSIYAIGVDKSEAVPQVDMKQHHAIALEVARQGAVLLKNEDILPLASDTKHIAVIGGFAQLGVLSGGGSSLVTPPRGFASIIPLGGDIPTARHNNLYFTEPSPISELKKLFPETIISYDPGLYPSEAAALARRCDIAIIFAIKPACEGFDSPDLSLPFGQEALIEAVVSANPNTIVVLETGNPVVMPWKDKVKAVLEAWYPGQAGGQAIAEILAGITNPSGRLPMTFPADITQLPRPELPGFGTPWGTPVPVHYHEGAEVGYRWFVKMAQKPLYAFGHGLSYTKFSYRDFKILEEENLIVRCTVTNIGERAGADVPQIYLTEAAGEKRMRLLGFERVELLPRESKTVQIVIDPRLLACFDKEKGLWRIAKGSYKIALGKAADEYALFVETIMPFKEFGG